MSQVYVKNFPAEWSEGKLKDVLEKKLLSEDPPVPGEGKPRHKYNPCCDDCSLTCKAYGQECTQEFVVVLRL